MGNAKWEAFERGRQMFRDAVFRPRVGLEDDEWSGPCTEAQCEWLGWMIERGLKLKTEWDKEEMRSRLHDWAERGASLPDEYLR